MQRLVIGSVASLDDPRFSQENGKLGLWKPREQEKAVGTGVYFLGEYDPNKEPVIFVSGAGGYPQEWKKYIDKLDKDKYQPWVFVYPSGDRLHTSRDNLKSAVEEIYKATGKRPHITAHSMGGLVARGAAKDLADSNTDAIASLTTIATPYNGHKGAWFGVKASPFRIVDSWRDMVPDSKYQQEILNGSIRGKVPHNLMYGDINGTDDGAVSVKSQRDQRAERDAEHVKGYQKSHTDILQDDAAISDWLGWLDKRSSRP